jgi:hypothetical protein
VIVRSNAEQSARTIAESPAPPRPLEEGAEGTPNRKLDSQHERRTRGGLALAAGATRFFGLVPLGGDMTAGARFQAAAALGGDSSGFLSTATLGLSGGMDVGTNRGVDAQIWHGGLVLAVGAPWSSRDIFGIGIEGGLIGGSYYDGNPIAYQSSTKNMVNGPYGESIGPSPYGLTRVTLQLPLDGPLRPFLAGEIGGAQRDDGRLSGIAGVTGGVVWNAW